ncbi:hypothetical protein [Bacillus sp. JCM 19034]|uniref:hypothetical protein n=1 Tax=Bacillus sp. JCM 19034 TaxID=1481928 RepID=UPI000AEA252E|nr:hypothetical protein [Bacillus sp. JCM 19034]
MAKFEEPFHTFWHGEVRQLPKPKIEKLSSANNKDHPYYKLKTAIQQEIVKND